MLQHFSYLFIRRLFENPSSIPQDILDASITNFEMEVDSCLRLGSSGKNVINVVFRHDCFNFLFNHDQKLLQQQDFNDQYFSLDWDQVIKNHDKQGNQHGVKVLFPVEVQRKYLKWMTRGHYKQRDGKITKKEKRFKEVIQFKIRKANF